METERPLKLLNHLLVCHICCKDGRNTKCVALSCWSPEVYILHHKVEHEMSLPLKVCSVVVLACPLIQLLAGRAATFSHMSSLLCGQCFQCYHRRCAGSLTEAAAVQYVCFAPCSSDATAGRRGSDSTTLQQCPLQKPAHQALGCSN